MSKDVLPEDWTNYSYSSYIPEGYELVSYMKTEVSKNMRFINGDKKFLLSETTFDGESELQVG